MKYRRAMKCIRRCHGCDADKFMHLIEAAQQFCVSVTCLIYSMVSGHLSGMHTLHAQAPIGWPLCGNKIKNGTKNSIQILQQFLYLRGATYLQVLICVHRIILVRKVSLCSDSKITYCICTQVSKLLLPLFL